MKSFGKYKMFFAAMLLAAVAIIVVPHQAHAWYGPFDAWHDLTNTPTNVLTDITGNFIAWLVYYVGWVITWLLSFVIGLIVYFITIILQLNTQVVSSIAVQSGFTVTLAVANLGFVFGIIVIAIATILRRETYGIKKTLWKLVVAAILVNFSLVIGGVIINFANQLTTTFMAELPGGGTGIAGYNNFASSLMGAFGPQQLGLVGIVNSTSTFAGNAAAGALLSANILRPVISVLFAAATLITITITLVTFLIMLLIRYVTLSILLILMPLAWLLWIFPKTSHHFSSWWNEFIRWSFFAPIVMFFLALAIMTAGQMSTVNSTDPAARLQGLGYQAGTGSAILGGFLGNLTSGVSGEIGTVTNTIVGTLLQALIVVGLSVGGMYAANKLSIAGAGAALGAMTSVKNAAVGYAGKQAKKGVAAAVPTGLKERLQRGESSRLIPRRVQSWMGRGLQTVERAGTADLVEKESSWAKEQAKDPASAARLLAGSLNKEQQLALLKQMMDQNDLDQVKTVNGVELGKFLNEEKRFTGANQVKLYKDLNKRIESTRVAREAAQAISNEEKRIDPTVGAMQEQINTYDTRLAAINREMDRARKALSKDPNASYTDQEGVVTEKGTKMAAGAYIYQSTLKAGEITNKKQDMVLRRDEVRTKAEGAATVVDTQGKLGTVNAVVNAKELLEKEMEDHVASQKPADAQKALVNDIFGKGARLGFDESTANILGESFARAMARRAPGFAPSFLRNMKSDPLQNLQELYQGILKEEKEAAGEGSELAKHFEKLSKEFDRALSFNRSYVGGGEQERGEAEAPAAAPPRGNGSAEGGKP